MITERRTRVRRVRAAVPMVFAALTCSTVLVAATSAAAATTSITGTALSGPGGNGFTSAEFTYSSPSELGSGTMHFDYVLTFQPPGATSTGTGLLTRSDGATLVGTQTGTADFGFIPIHVVIHFTVTSGTGALAGTTGEIVLTGTSPGPGSVGDVFAMTGKLHFPPPPTHTCTGTLGGPADVLAPGTYASLVMPPGTVCITFGAVTVNHPIVLGDSSALAVFPGGSLTVSGPVTVGPNAFFGDGFSDSPITVNGGVTIQHNGVLSIGSENPGGPLLSTIHGPVQANDPSAVMIHNSDVSGPISLQGGGGTNAVLDVVVGSGYNFNDLEDNVISGPVTITGYNGIWAGVIRNRISGGLTFTGNTNLDEFDVGSNTIHGNANCSGNSPAVNTGGSPGAPNVVSGHTNTCG